MAFLLKYANGYDWWKCGWTACSLQVTHSWATKIPYTFTPNWPFLMTENKWPVSHQFNDLWGACGRIDFTYAMSVSLETSVGSKGYPLQETGYIASGNEPASGVLKEFTSVPIYSSLPYPFHLDKHLKNRISIESESIRQTVHSWSHCLVWIKRVVEAKQPTTTYPLVRSHIFHKRTHET